MQQLVAVMYTDIVGYTSIMEADEAMGKRLNERHKEVLHSQIERYNGVLQEVIGDGSLSYFISASDCVCCAVEMQIIS
ncbi:MAG: hypothetical protein M3R25_11280 [Bacteroidota bacterium]|nr:hypothetical protein [Bacteroidota bacterium]